MGIAILKGDKKDNSKNMKKHCQVVNLYIATIAKVLARPIFNDEFKLKIKKIWFGSVCYFHDMTQNENTREIQRDN